jgi:quercetin dioxygenase-like cupin family protein
MNGQTAGVTIVASETMEWVQSPFPGVSYKFLNADPGGTAVVNLLRMEKGAIVPPHRHSSPQLSYILSGRVKVLDGSYISAGSYVEVPAGVRHGSQAEEEVLWLDVFPGLLTWFLDDGRVFNLSRDATFNELGTVRPLGSDNMI